MYIGLVNQTSVGTITVFVRINLHGLVIEPAAAMKKWNIIHNAPRDGLVSLRLKCNTFSTLATPSSDKFVDGKL